MFIMLILNMHNSYALVGIFITIAALNYEAIGSAVARQAGRQAGSYRSCISHHHHHVAS
jgi:hypothetical protein